MLSERGDELPVVDERAAAKRRKAVDEINGVLADLERTRARVAAAEAEHERELDRHRREHEERLQRRRAELGTARAEERKLAERYAELRARLEKLLPEAGVETGPAS